MIHQPRRKSKAAPDRAEVRRLRQQGLSYSKIAKQLDSNYAAVYRADKAVPTNGDHSASERIDSALATLPQRVELVGEPVSAPPAHHDALERTSASERIDSAVLQDHESRLARLEAFIAAQELMARRASAPDAPERISASAHHDALQRIDPPVWVNRGTHLAADMIERIKTYAQEHRLEMREVIDLALRRFFAGEGSGDA
jgi:hypothetical protein